MQIRGIALVPALKQTFKEFREDDLPGLASEVAYHLLFSVVPLLIFLTSLSAFASDAIGVGDIMGSVNQWLFDHVPAGSRADVQETIEKILTNESGSVLSVGGVLALWGARNAMASLMKALNTTFGVAEGRPWWMQQAIAMGLTVALGVAIIGSGAAMLLGSGLGETFAGWVGLDEAFIVVWSWARWPVILTLVSAMLVFIYWAGPNVDVPMRWLVIGAVVTVVLWIVASFGLTIYFRYFAGYAEAYGPLGAVLAFVFWLYVMSMVLLLGGELNAVLAKTEDQSIVDTAKGSGGGRTAADRRRGTGKLEGRSTTGITTGTDDAEASPDSGSGPAPDRRRVALSRQVRVEMPAAASPLAPVEERRARAYVSGEGSEQHHRRGVRTRLALATAAVIAVLGGWLGRVRR